MFRTNGQGRLRYLAWVLSVALFCCPHAVAQSSRELGALRKRIESFEAGQRQIQEDLQILKNLLMEKQPAVEQLPLDNVVISTAGAASLGSVNSKVTIVEFSDYQCPFCGRYANDTYPRLIVTYSTGTSSVPTPEPSSVILLLTGIVVLFFARQINLRSSRAALGKGGL